MFITVKLLKDIPHWHWEIIDSDFTEIVFVDRTVAISKMLCAAVISIYKRRGLPVVPNLFAFITWNGPTQPDEIYGSLLDEYKDQLDKYRLLR